MATKFPSFEQLQDFSVNRTGQYEVIKQSLYDEVTYASAGQTSLIFFQVPKGQSGKTIADTNLTLAGQLASPINFLVYSVELLFLPGGNPLTVANNDADTTVSALEFTNDVYQFARNGSLRLTIGSKAYLEEAPLGVFPSKTWLETQFGAALHYTQATAADASRQIIGAYASLRGRPYATDPELLIAPTQNFDVTLTWPAAVPLPSGNDARLFCRLDGLLYRLSQ